MKKRDLLFSGLMLMALPLAAQVEPVEAPQFNPQTDPEVLFVQDFEADFDAWAATEIDTINGVWYYKTTTGTNTNWNPYADEGHEIYAWRDTLIHMYNGVVKTDDKTDIATDAFSLDSYTIVEDPDDSRQEEFNRFGEDGGKHYFRYVADHKTGNTGNAYTDGVVAEYRRNLFVRGLPITPETSYRLTIYLRGVSTAKTTVPTFSADVMRGYFHSEKPFTMGLNNNASNYEYNNTFAYTLERGFTGDWQKITFMTYYLNDSIAERFMHNQYYWDDWKWAANPGEDSVIRIKQPDKFFVRLAFRSDSTTFEVDNISLTKSWIGGIQHYKDKLRVDFGYQTNLKELAAAAKATTGIGAVELPGDYFEVIGRLAGEEDWYKVEILSAEYHDDGYMYMWAKPMVEGGDEIPVYFDEYFDSVLVSFTNPDDKALRLNYNGSNFPMALDTAWIKAGKKVPNFYHEPSSPNPYVFNGVYSMKDLPPVLRFAQYEDNSFNLPGTLTSMDFTFSRGVQYDVNATEATQYAAMQVTKGGVMETWFITAEKSGNDKDMVYTFTRPSNYQDPLVGDYEFKLINIKDRTTDFSQPTVLHYSFGDTEIPEGLVAYVDFGSVDNFDWTTNSTPISGFSSSHCTSKVTEFGGLYSKGLMFGIYSKNNGAENNENNCVKLFYDFNIPATGDYEISFGMTGCQKGSYNDDCRTVIFVQDAAGNKVDGASLDRGSTGFKPNEGAAIENVKIDTIAATLEAGSYKLAFTLPNEGSYGGSHKGGKILFFIAIVEKGGTVPESLPFGYAYISKFNGAYGALAGVVSKGVSEPDKYAGELWAATKIIAEQYAQFTDTRPSRYNTVCDSLSNATSTLSARYAVVDAFWKAHSDAIDKLSQYDDDAIADGVEYSELEAYQAYDDLISNYENYVCSNKTDDEIKAAQKEIEDAGKVLDARKALMDAFTVAQKYVKGLIDDSLYVTIPQWTELIAAFNDSKDAADAITSMIDSDVESATNDLYDAGHNYAWYMPLKQAATVRLLALDSIAQSLNVDFGSHKADVEERLANAADDDLGLAEIYKTAIKAAVYQKFAAGGTVDSLDLTGFIRNFNLYTVATAADVDKYYYQWGTPNDRWKAKAGENTKIFPGWVVNPNGNNVHIGSEAIQWDANTAPADAYLAMDWNAFVSMSQEVVGLPAGIYNIGVGFNVCVDAGNNKHKFIVSTNDNSYTALAPTNIGSDTHIRPEAANVFNDSVVVADGDVVKLQIQMANVNSWAMIDNFAAYLIGSTEFDYSAAYTTVAQELEELLNYVDAAAAQKISVEFYGLDGIKRESIKSGEVIIKVSTSANGRRTVEKVLVK